MAKREFSSGGIVARKSGNSFFVLLIKDSYGRWTWPKGNIDKPESSEDAAIREIAEEVGIKDAEILERVGETQYFYKLHNILRFKTVYIYLCETKQSKLKLQKSEITDGGWFTPREALERIEYKGARDLLRKAVKRYSAIKKL